MDFAAASELGLRERHLAHEQQALNLPNACGAGECAGHWWILLG